MLRHTLSGSGPRFCISVYSLRTNRILAFFMSLQSILVTFFWLLLTKHFQVRSFPFSKTMGYIFIISSKIRCSFCSAGTCGYFVTIRADGNLVKSCVVTMNTLPKSVVSLSSLLKSVHPGSAW